MRGTKIMSITEIIIVAIGLSMDAFAVAIGKGLSLTQVKWKHALIVGAYFGVFQALMPLLGYLLGTQFADYITSYDHWIAFVLLAIIGGKMVKDSFAKEDDRNVNKSLRLGTMLPLAIATSIDALAVGVSFAFLKVDIVWSVVLIGCITLVISMAGVKIGNIFGIKYRSKAELAGGIILILIGLKILLEHLGVISF